MAFSQAGIAGVRVVADGSDLFVSWTSDVASGSIFQVYADRRLAWYGASSRCHIPLPSGGPGRNVWVEVGVVAPGEPTTDYSSSLMAPGGRSERARLSWSGGTYLDPTGGDDIQSFSIFRGPSAGSPVEFSAPVDTVAAYPGGWINDGFGKGGFGNGGFGRASTLYEWSSGPLTSGTWRFAVRPVDKAGNVASFGSTISVAINAAPLPPAMDPTRSRLTATYGGPSHPNLTLNWLPSPSE